MKRSCLIFLSVVLLLTQACTRKTRVPPEYTTPHSVVEKELMRSRAEILSQLSELRDVTTPAPTPFEEHLKATTDFTYPVHLSWNGPLDTGVAALATRIGWKAKRFGPKPVSDILVSCYGQETAYDVLQSFQSQAGTRARISLDEEAKIIKIIYGSDIPDRKRSVRRSHSSRKGKVERQVIRHSRHSHHSHKTQRTHTPKTRVPSDHKPSLPTKPAESTGTSSVPQKPNASVNLNPSSHITRTTVHKERTGANLQEVFSNK